MANTKYKNEKVQYDGIIFDSKKEAKRYKELLLLQKANLITNLRTQPKFTLIQGFLDNEGVRQRGTAYIADFEYYDIESSRWIVEDVKSKITAKLPLFKLKLKLFKSLYRNRYFRIVWLCV